MTPACSFYLERAAPTQGGAATSKLAISVFGGVSISFDRQELQLTNRKARALLAYLALSETGREGRERLAGLLWPDTSEQNARASLREVLMDLREALSACGCHALVPGRQDVELISHAVDVDLIRILDDIAAGRTPEMLLMQARVGETILSGYDDISPLFHDWVVATRVPCTGAAGSRVGARLRK